MKQTPCPRTADLGNWRRSVWCPRFSVPATPNTLKRGHQTLGAGKMRIAASCVPASKLDTIHLADSLGGKRLCEQIQSKLHAKAKETWSRRSSAGLCAGTVLQWCCFTTRSPIV